MYIYFEYIVLSIPVLIIFFIFETLQYNYLRYNCSGIDHGKIITSSFKILHLSKSSKTMILVGSMGDWYVCEKCKHATMEEKNEENYGTVTSSLNEIATDQLGLPKVAHYHIFRQIVIPDTARFNPSLENTGKQINRKYNTNENREKVSALWF